LAATFLAAGFFAATAFLATGFLAATFLAAGFFAATAFLAVGFFAAVFLAAAISTSFKVNKVQHNHHYTFCIPQSGITEALETEAAEAAPKTEKNPSPAARDALLTVVVVLGQCQAVRI
jgi:hypothetical protein